jgi:hypothetical protein
VRPFALGLILAGVSSTAFAAPEPVALLAQPAPEPAAGADAGLAVTPPDEGRQFDMELGFRGRYMGVPRSILDIWFFDDDAPGWIHNQPRPGVKGYSAGIEFVVKSKVEEDSSGGNDGIFYVQWLANLTPDGYWDDREEPAIHTDGDYLAPTRNLGLVLLGANYAYELHMVKTMNTNGNFGMSMLVGGGLGAAILVGDLEYWRPEGGVTAIERFEAGEPKEGDKPIPPVLPIVDLNLALRFNFGDRLVLRFEGGLQNMLYGGGSLGLMF